MRRFSLALALAAFCLGFPDAGRAADISGAWRSEHMQVVVEAGSGDVLTLKENNPGSKTSLVGEIVGEARKTGADEWLGRHIWGGKKYGSTKWGEDGGLYMKLRSENELFIQYRDSQYDGGWVLSR